MKRTAFAAAIVAMVLAGCASANPVVPQKFDTKLLNLYSIGSQQASQLNYIPNAQTNLANQVVTTNSIANFPIASAVGTGAAVATNLTGQGILNAVAQVQSQQQLVL